MAQRDALPRGSEDNRFPLDPALWQEIAEEMRLAPQQERIVRLMLCNLQNRQIAKRLNIEESTLKTYVQRVYQRHHVTNRTELVVRIMQLALRIAGHEDDPPQG